MSDRKGKRPMKKAKRDPTPPLLDSDSDTIEMGSTGSEIEVLPDPDIPDLEDIPSKIYFICPILDCKAAPLTSRSHLLRHCRQVHGRDNDQGYWVQWDAERHQKFRDDQAKAQREKRKRRKQRETQGHSQPAETSKIINP